MSKKSQNTIATTIADFVVTYMRPNIAGTWPINQVDIRHYGLEWRSPLYAPIPITQYERNTTRAEDKRVLYSDVTAILTVQHAPDTVSLHLAKDHREYWAVFTELDKYSRLLEFKLLLDPIEPLTITEDDSYCSRPDLLTTTQRLVYRDLTNTDWNPF